MHGVEGDVGLFHLLLDGDEVSEVLEFTVLAAEDLNVDHQLLHAVCD